MWHRLTGTRVILIVLAQTTILPKPREGPLDAPPARQNLKALSGGAATYDVQYPSSEVDRSCCQRIVSVL